MSKNILILTGSPRQGGNSDILADAFTKGAEKSGNAVRRFETARKSIKGCMACNSCFSKGKACVYDDDFDELAPMLEWADLLVFATPLYWFTFPVQLKAAIDKLYSFLIAEKEWKIKKGILLVCGADENLDGYAGIVKSYELMLDCLKWGDAGQIIAVNVTEKGDVLKTDFPSQAEQLGAGIQ